MTVQEAIMDIKENIKPVDGGKSLDMAIEALEKQIPKKPIFVDIRFRHHGKSIADGCSLSKCYKCPGCNTHIFRVWDDKVFCEYCGQKLDWGVNDGK